MSIQRISSNDFRLPGTVGSRILAAIFLIYLAPVILAVALLIKFAANGPVLTRRRRCLPNNGPVDLWEFRTTALAGNAVGTFLRASRLDLLPRLVNMVRGEVTLASLFR